MINYIKENLGHVCIDVKPEESTSKNKSKFIVSIFLGIAFLGIVFLGGFYSGLSLTEPSVSGAIRQDIQSSATMAPTPTPSKSEDLLRIGREPIALSVSVKGYSLLIQSAKKLGYEGAYVHVSDSYVSYDSSDPDKESINTTKHNEPFINTSEPSIDTTKLTELSILKMKVLQEYDEKIYFVSLLNPANSFVITIDVFDDVDKLCYMKYNDYVHIFEFIDGECTDYGQYFLSTTDPKSEILVKSTGVSPTGKMLKEFSINTYSSYLMFKPVSPMMLKQASFLMDKMASQSMFKFGLFAKP
jgi:hypothetical protein